MLAADVCLDGVVCARLQAFWYHEGVGYALLAALALSAHLAFILWVIGGALFTLGRPFWSWVHVGTMIYGVIIEAGPWPCPLTILEQHFEEKAGIGTYHQPFLVHYLEAIIYPNVSEIVLVWCATAVCAINGAIYGRRLWKARRIKQA